MLIFYAFQVLDSKMFCLFVFMFFNSDVPEGFRVYTDDVNKFKILIPQGE